MRHSRRFLAFLLPLAVIPLIASAQVVVAGRVTNDAGVGLSSAQVLIEGTTIGTSAGNDGVSDINYPAADNNFSDGSRAYFDKCADLLTLEMERPVVILTPFITLTKSDVIRLSRPDCLAMAFSCVAPVHGRHCGACIKCCKKKAAFSAAACLAFCSVASRSDSSFALCSASSPYCIA